MKTKTTALTKGGVLLLASDSALQQGARAALEAEHYEVLPATNRDEARELLDAGNIEVLVLEADHEPQNLVPLLAQFRVHHPHLRVIGICEQGHKAVSPDLPGVNVWMEKPLRSTRLVPAVNGLLAELRAQAFREQLLRRETIPLFSPAPYPHWGLNE